LPNSPIARVCATSPLASTLLAPNSISAACAIPSLAAPWPTPTKNATDASSPTFSGADSASCDSLIRRTLWSRIGKGCLCTGLHHYRSLPLALPVGQVWPSQGSYQTAHSVQPARDFHTIIIVSTGKVHDVNIFDQLSYEAGSFYVFDRAYLDFGRFHRLHTQRAFFVTQAKNT
jgi:hypothetical protein